MDFDQTAIEQFIGDYFRHRTSALRLQVELHHRFWRRFYDTQCQWDSRRGVVEKSESERIESVSLSPVGAWVVTTGETIYRSRYDVRPNQDRWLIHEVDIECPLCRGKSLSRDCAHCGGTGWISWKDRATRHALPAARRKSLDAELETDLDQILLRGIDRFMADHFRERTLAQKQELEILAAFASRFCSQGLDWARWGPPMQDGQSERILRVTPLRAGVQIISSGLQGLRLRYQLRPMENSWLIAQVDPECLQCYRNGPNPNCFWCGGTIWDRKRSISGPEPSRLGGDEPASDAPRW